MLKSRRGSLVIMSKVIISRVIISIVIVSHSKELEQLKWSKTLLIIYVIMLGATEKGEVATHRSGNSSKWQLIEVAIHQSGNSSKQQLIEAATH